MKQQCPLSEVCHRYRSGDSRPPNQDVRDKVVCAKWIKMDKDYCNTVYWLVEGQYPMCNIKSVKKKKEDLTKL